MLVQCLFQYVLQIVVFIFSCILQVLIRVNDLSVSLKSENIGNTFDYVIVGGGSAGAVVAARLSENPNVSVLLIEAGGYGLEILNIPVLGPLKQLSDLDWQYTTVPQNYSCFGLDSNVSRWPSGKGLGGSTHLNCMIYLKGVRNDYLTWKDPESSHWDQLDISFYFEKALRCVRPHEWESGGCGGQGGSILVRKGAAHSTELSESILQAARELNYSVNDLNAKAHTGFMKPQLNMNEFGRRWTSDQYLKRVKGGRKNLKILTNVIAEKILLRDGFEAYAVRIRRNEGTDLVFAKNEVVVSAGAVGSAKLLMLSGIGPADVLAEAKHVDRLFQSSREEVHLMATISNCPTVRELNEDWMRIYEWGLEAFVLRKGSFGTKEIHVEQHIDLPVGRNLQDHVTTGLDLVLMERSLFSFAELMLPSAFYRYFVRGEGPLASGLVEALGVVHSPLADPLRDSPDLELMVLVAGLSSDRGVFLRRSMGVSEKVWKGYFRHLGNESVVSILPVLLHPKSRGSIALDPVDPEGKPKINPRYLSEQEDVMALVEGIRIIQKMVETSPMKELGAKFNRRKLPGCESLEFDSDAYWECYVRHLTLTAYHPVGTCKMAALSDGGVVDYTLRVHKTNNLRVIDASVIPILPSANINAAVVMLAEKGADLIKEDLIKRHSSCRPAQILLSPNICPHP